MLRCRVQGQASGLFSPLQLLYPHSELFFKIEIECADLTKAMVWQYGMHEPTDPSHREYSDAI
jgi:hypothetical protein